MKQSLFLISTLLVIIMFSACSDDHEATGKKDCTFEQNDDDMDGRIDETERSIMKGCDQQAFTSKSDIKSNLIGEWELVGHGEGWTYRPSQPCGYITFTENEYEFEFNDGHTDTLITQSWDIDEIETTNGTYFRLRTEPHYFYALFASVFCSDYFYGDATPSDGNMYLYEKMR